MNVQYDANVFDDLVDIYECWVLGDNTCMLCWRFYQNFCDERVGTIVELGVGMGHIAINVAARGRNHVMGIDSSSRMLEACRKRATDAGVLNRLSLVHGDLRHFQVPDPIPTVILPYRTLGHLVEEVDRQMMFEHVHSAIVPGGLFVFDFHIHDESWAIANEQTPQLMYSGPRNDGANIRIWSTYKNDVENNRMICAVTIEELNDQHHVTNCRHVYFPLVWIQPEEIRAMAERAGFEVEDVYGGFERQPVTSSSVDQVWVLRRV